VNACRNGQVKFDEAFQSELAGIVQALFGSLRQFHSSVKAAYAEWYRDRFAVPADYSVEWDNAALGCALAQLYVRLGGQHPVPRPIVERFPGLTDWFDSSKTDLFVK
jgi:hypothetical protein